MSSTDTSDSARAKVPWFERGFAAAVSVAAAPVAVARAAAAYAREGRVFDTHPRLDAEGRVVELRSFAGDLPGRRLPFLVPVATGRLRLFGPYPVHPEDDRSRTARPPHTVPGLMSRARLRARTGIDYESEVAAEAIDIPETVPEKAGLLARYVVAEALAGGPRETPGNLHILGVEIVNTSMAETLDWISREIARPHPTALLAFVNSDCLNLAVENPDYRRCLLRHERVVPDGIGVKIAARMQGYDLVENVNGTDMLPRLCAQAEQAGHSLYFLGARPGVAQAAADAMLREHPRLRVAGTRHGYFDPAQADAVVQEINDSGADILLVALGAPQQEQWLDRYRDDLTVGVAMGVGGQFDFYSGRIPRAPIWVREVGGEWVWRLAQEPGRLWRRYVVGNPKFLRRAYLEARRIRKDAPVRPSRSPLLNYGLPYHMQKKPRRSA